MLAPQLFALALKIVSEVVATPLNDASKPYEQDVITKTQHALQTKDGCAWTPSERTSLIFVLRFDKAGAASVEPSYVPDSARGCLIERMQKLRLAPGAERGFAVNVAVN